MYFGIITDKFRGLNREADFFKASNIVKRRYPWTSIVLMIGLGFVPLALVTHYYGVLPNRMVIQWDVLGRLTVIGTRASSVLFVANVAAFAGLAGSVLAFWQHKALSETGTLRSYLALNFAQIVAINLTCFMLVSDALGMGLTIKPMIPPAMAVLLFAAGVLCWKIDAGARSTILRIIAGLFALMGLILLGVNAFVANEVVGYYSSVIALLAMVALVLPSKR